MGDESNGCNNRLLRLYRIIINITNMSEIYKTANPPVTKSTLDFIDFLTDEQFTNIMLDPQEITQARFCCKLWTSGEIKTDRDLAGLVWIVDTMGMLSGSQVDAFFGLSE